MDASKRFGLGSRVEEKWKSHDGSNGCTRQRLAMRAYAGWQQTFEERGSAHELTTVVRPPPPGAPKRAPARGRDHQEGNQGGPASAFAPPPGC